MRRFREEGAAGLVDRSSRPGSTPHRTPAEVEARVCELRRVRKPGPARIVPILGPPASTVHRILTRHGLHRLAWIDRPTGTVIRRYERARPGELVHVDVKKLGRIPNGGVWRVRGRAEARAANPAGRRTTGFDYIHSAADDHSRLACNEIHPDETADTCAGSCAGFLRRFLRRAAAFFAAHGIARIERVLTDNATAYRKSFAFRQALADIGATAKHTRPWRPPTNGKVERFNRTMLEEWAYLRPYTSNHQRTNHQRTAAFDDFLHAHNYHRCHTALVGQPPISRLDNPARQYA